MTITDPAGPLPATVYGKADWQDYISNWREKDAEWIQERSILRYASSAARDNPTTGVISPTAGQTIYNAGTDRLETWSALRTAWVGALMLQYLTSTSDTSSGVNVSHASAAGKGITFAPAQVSIDTPTVNIGNGMLVATANNVGLQTPAQGKATLTTAGTGTATELISDTKLAAPGLRLTSAGPITTTGAVSTGALTATSLALGSGTMSTTGAVTGASFTATGVLSGATLSVSGVGSINSVTFPAPGNYVQASGGYVASSGYHYGDANGAIMAYRNPSGGAVSTHQLHAKTDHFSLYGGQSVWWYNAGGTHAAYIAPVVVSGSDPGPTNWPDGTIWIQP